MPDAPPLPLEASGRGEVTAQQNAPATWRSLFRQEWWLDAVAPGRWEERSVGTGAVPEAHVAWCVAGRRPGLVRLVQPPLSRLGPWVAPGTGGRPALVGRHHRLLSALVEQLPKHDLCQFRLDPGQEDWLALHWAGFEARGRVTYVLDDLSSEDRLWAGLSDKTRNAVRRGARSATLRHDLGGAVLSSLVAASLHRSHASGALPAGLVERVHDAALEHGAGLPLFAVDGQGRCVAAALFVWDADTIYYLLAGADQEGRASGAMSFLLWEGLRSAAGGGRRLDFEGSMLPAVEHFVRGFGGRPATYLALERRSRRLGAASGGRELWRGLARR